MQITHSNDFVDSRSPSRAIQTSTWLKRALARFIDWVLPIRIKRLIFISTLFAGIKNITDPSDTHLHKLNDLMKLSEIDQAIGLPMCFGNWLWKKRLPEGIFLRYQKDSVLQLCEINNKELSDVEMRIIANTVINRTPAWLLYTSRRKMRDDLIQLLGVMPQLGCGNSDGH